MKGAAQYRPDTSPLIVAENVSAMTPPEMAIGAEPKLPAKKRNIMSECILDEAAAPAVKAVNEIALNMKIGRRP
jgi:hypothetical protein